MITENFNRRRELQEISIHTDLVVAGGGLTGVCCPDFGNDSPYLFTPMYEASFKGTKR